MNDIRRILHSSAVDTESLRDIFSNIDPGALDKKMYQNLSIFFQSKKERNCSAYFMFILLFASEKRATCR